MATERGGYAGVSYEGLQKLQEHIERVLAEGLAEPDLKLQLRDIIGEMGRRRFALVVSDGRRRKEWGRWQSREVCEQVARDYYLPVGDYLAEGRRFTVRVEPVQGP